jgi:hypothetical protein
MPKRVRSADDMYASRLRGYARQLGLKLTRTRAGTWRMNGETFVELTDVHIWFYDHHRKWVQAVDAAIVARAQHWQKLTAERDAVK